jgi:hypothetical protein
LDWGSPPAQSCVHQPRRRAFRWAREHRAFSWSRYGFADFNPQATYRADVLRVIDGDTFEARVRIWSGFEITTRVRLRAIDAPELHARFSNRPIGVKRFQTIHHYSVMSLAGSCFSSESAPRPFHHGIRRRGGTICAAALPSDRRQVQADMRTHLIHRPARDIFPPRGGARFSSSWI